jgi:hypothetical protein
MTLTPKEATRIKTVQLQMVKTFGETKESYIQIASAGLALPLPFTQAVLGKNTSENGLRSVRGSYALYGAWICLREADADALPIAVTPANLGSSARRIANER